MGVECDYFVIIHQCHDASDDLTIENPDISVNGISLKKTRRQF